MFANTSKRWAKVNGYSNAKKCLNNPNTCRIYSIYVSDSLKSNITHVVEENGENLVGLARILRIYVQTSFECYFKHHITRSVLNKVLLTKKTILLN